MILDRPNNFGRVPIVLDGSNSFWLSPIYFGQVQIIKISPEKSNLYLIKMIWTRPKQFVPVQNYFVPIEGQGIRCRSGSSVLIIIDKLNKILTE